jgi:hypothetical protein
MSGSAPHPPVTNAFRGVISLAERVVLADSTPRVT